MMKKTHHPPVAFSPRKVSAEEEAKAAQAAEAASKAERFRAV